jgi:hypothetical protein
LFDVGNVEISNDWIRDVNCNSASIFAPLQFHVTFVAPWNIKPKLSAFVFYVFGMFTFSSVGVFEDPKVAVYGIASKANENHRTNFGNSEDLLGEDKLDVIDGREINDRMNSLVNFF